MPSQGVSYNVFGSSIGAPKYTHARVLAANVAETITVPSDGLFMVITGTQGFWMNVTGAAAVVPAADVTDGTASFYIPGSLQCKVEPGMSVSVLMTSAGYVTAAFYNKD